jgi:hypothetical protein
MADRSALVRGWAATAIGDIARRLRRPGQFVRRLRACLAEDPHEFVRVCLGGALCSSGDGSGLETVLLGLRGRSYHARCAAANTLVELSRIDAIAAADRAKAVAALSAALGRERTVAARGSIADALAALSGDDPAS